MNLCYIGGGPYVTIPAENQVSHKELRGTETSPVGPTKRGHPAMSDTRLPGTQYYKFK